MLLVLTVSVFNYSSHSISLSFFSFIFSDFLQFQNNLYGNCFVFNHAANMTEPRNTGKTGALNGNKSFFTFFFSFAEQYYFNNA